MLCCILFSVNGAMNEVMMNISSEFPSGELPLHGFFKLGSSYNVMNFIGNDHGRITPTCRPEHHHCQVALLEMFP